MIINTIKVYERLKSMAANPENKIFIYGAGKQGNELYYEFLELGIKINAFLDKNHVQFKDGVFCDIPVLNPEDISEIPLEKIFVVVSVSRMFEIIRVYLEEHGLKMGIHFADFGIDSDFRSCNLQQLKPYLNNIKFPALAEIVKSKQRQNTYCTGEMTKKAIPNFSIDYSHLDEVNYIAALGLLITSYCNLSCKLCGAAIPYCKKREHFDAQQITQDLDKFLEVSYISNVAIAGGEPFLHPQLSDIMRNISNLKNLNKIGSIRIITNAVLLPKDEVLKSILNLNTYIRTYVHMSNYREKSKNMNNLIDKCNALGIPFLVNTEDYSYFRDLGDFSYDRNYTSLELQNLNKLCDWNSVCPQFIDGKIYSCSRLPFLNEYKLIPYDETAFIDVRNTPIEDLSSDFSDYFYNKTRNCQFCDGCAKFSPIVSNGEQ